MSTALPPGSVIGIVGGGQLGRMSAVAAARLGYRVHVLAQSEDEPAVQTAGSFTLGAFDDQAALHRFAEQVDVITFEFENIPAEGLDLLSSLKPVRPSGEILRISQDRLAEKAFMAGADIPVAPWLAVTSADDVTLSEERLSWPVILKTTRLGYDGKGQRRVHDREGFLAAFEELRPHPLVAEAVVDFEREISVMVVRSADGSSGCSDPVENRHRDGILDITLAPAPIDPELACKARALALRIAERLDLTGILGVEMFVTRDGDLLINEIAPRPHNSGHWTMDACGMDQFEAHIRAVAGLPVTDLMRHSDAVMKNLVGPDDMALWPEIIASPGMIPHHYGKTEARPGRKMGHVNILFPRGALPGEFGVQDALGCLAERPGM
ncbi:5-(carboxyamino)imidazole ribonucleotide synthase [Acetobacter sp. AN02]|uniref:5-(carboxyamino)imidazole ribonucleotide synthase n=1 Tax=Acetobacter sp. AN02 TaxID=2894186 RepID=UPI0024343492|nr:5-(carboxyamino)imidazole ribonucleotide synthase [Acetobacter sp. AN02]MDG6093959.1 5-(carboxyamino)imidazole ribonucleotide synthase [Acetobacter sp. AN02]